jgi:hypothetical protein
LFLKHQVDFANRYLGGGVLAAGSVQEEIMFLIMPGAFAARSDSKAQN